MSALSNATVYFGYGSNLWQEQMHVRCPTSDYLGIARLDDYRWMISERSYANVVQVKPSSSAEPSYSNVVYGLVYSLLPSDEERLDRYEGVPISYTKENLTVSFWRKEKEGKPIDIHKDPESTEMLVYIDRERTTDGEPAKEYIPRMNHGIHDALKEGVPKDYVDEVMRKFIPPQDGSELHEQPLQQPLIIADER